LAQPMPPAQNAPVMDPNFLAYINQQLAQYAAATGGQYTPPPAPEPTLEWPEALALMVARSGLGWVSEAQHNAVHAAIGKLVATVHSMEQDLAAIRARIPVLAAPVTPQQQQVLAAAGQPVPPQPQAPVPPAPMPGFPGFFPGTATVVAPGPGAPAFGPTGTPLVPPAPPAPPQAATFPQPFAGTPQQPAQVPVG